MQYSFRIAAVAAFLPLASACGLIDSIKDAANDLQRSIDEIQEAASREVSGVNASIGAAVGAVGASMDAVGGSMGGGGSDDENGMKSHVAALKAGFAAADGAPLDECDGTEFEQEVPCEEGTQVLTFTCSSSGSNELTLKIETVSENCVNPGYGQGNTDPNGNGGDTDPDITAISPSVVAAGYQVAIYGTGFGDQASGSRVRITNGATTRDIDALSDAIQSWNDTGIVATLPDDLEDGDFDVTVFNVGRGVESEAFSIEINNTYGKLSAAQSEDQTTTIDGTATIEVSLEINEGDEEPTFTNLRADMSQSETIEVGGQVVHEMVTDGFSIQSDSFGGDFEFALTLNGRLSVSNPGSSVDSTYDDFSLEIAGGEEGGVSLDMNGGISLDLVGPTGTECVSDSFEFETLQSLVFAEKPECAESGELRVTTSGAESTYLFDAPNVTVVSGDNEVTKTCAQLAAEAAAACGIVAQ